MGSDDPVVLHAIRSMGFTIDDLPLERLAQPNETLNVFATASRTCVTWESPGTGEPISYEVAAKGLPSDRTVYLCSMLPQTVMEACVGMDVSSIVTLPGMGRAIITSTKHSPLGDWTILHLGQTISEGDRN